MNRPFCNESLCKRCKYRFRRVFIPLDNSDYVTNNKKELADEENIVILNYCLLLDDNIDTEITIECSHFVAKESDNEVNLFKHNI